MTAVLPPNFSSEISSGCDWMELSATLYIQGFPLSHSSWSWSWLLVFASSLSDWLSPFPPGLMNKNCKSCHSCQGTLIFCWAACCHPVGDTHSMVHLRILIISWWREVNEANPQEWLKQVWLAMSTQASGLRQKPKAAQHDLCQLNQELDASCKLHHNRSDGHAREYRWDCGKWQWSP